MAFDEHPMQALSRYLPAGSFTRVVGYLHQYKVHLSITRKRRSVLGDYRHPGWGKNHRISINGDLNPFEFLLTLLHELAHLLVFEKYGGRVEAHGSEWKQEYGTLLLDFVQATDVFPEDIRKVLQKTIRNPAATANGETELLLVLRRYDRERKPGVIHLADLPPGALFQTEKGRLFRKGPLRRKRFECIEVKTGTHYAFSAIAEVRPVDVDG